MMSKQLIYDRVRPQGDDRVGSHLENFVSILSVKGVPILASCDLPSTPERQGSLKPQVRGTRE
jgi:hypothetical protein